jgi:hypothetical protein
MAFTSANLNLVAGSKAGNAPQMWTYQTADADVNGSGYFNPVAALLKKGDLVYAYVNTGATAAYKMYVVTANTGTAVTVALSMTVAAD